MNNSVVQRQGPGAIPSATGSGQATPSSIGTIYDTTNPLNTAPKLRLKDLVSPVGDDGETEDVGRYERPGTR